LGWDSIGNGELLRTAAAADFEVMTTNDSAMQYQQHEADLPLAVVVLRAKSNALAAIEPFAPALLGLLATPLDRRFVVIDR
jgi:hypothetical protein